MAEYHQQLSAVEEEKAGGGGEKENRNKFSLFIEIDGKGKSATCFEDRITPFQVDLC